MNQRLHDVLLRLKYRWELETCA